MTYGYSIELRARALANLDSGKSRQEVCEIFQISLKTLFNWIKLRKETGDFQIKDRPKVRSHRKLTKEILLAYLENNGDAYLKEIGEALGVSGTAVFKAMKKFGITRKKNNPIRRAKREKTSRFHNRNQENRS